MPSSLRLETSILLSAALTLASCAAETPPGIAEAPNPAALAMSGVLPAHGMKPAERWIGVVTPREVVVVTAMVGGRLLSVRAEVGDRIGAGALVARLDDRELRHRLAGAEAAVAAARAAAERQRLRLQRARAEEARRGRLHELLASAAIEEAIFLRREAEADVAVAEREVERLAAQRAELEDQVRHCEVRAPTGGIVASRPAESQPLLRAGDEILRLLPEDGLMVRFAVPPEEVASLSLRTEVVATFLDDPTQTRRGSIIRLAPAIDGPSGMVFVEADLVRRVGVPPVGTVVTVRRATPAP